MAAGYGVGTGIRREVFVSYHHLGDQAYYDRFSRSSHDLLKVITDNSLDRRIDSTNPDYVKRRIREFHLHGSSCTIVLCGAASWSRKFIDWEIKASLDQKMGVVGIKLPTLRVIGDASRKPPRLQDNIDSGYAIWTTFETVIENHGVLMGAIEGAIAMPKSRIANDRPMMGRNL
ncbi:MAG: TIR domain-containing protein [Pacificimonas sp.]